MSFEVLHPAAVSRRELLRACTGACSASRMPLKCPGALGRDSDAGLASWTRVAATRTTCSCSNEGMCRAVRQCADFPTMIALAQALARSSGTPPTPPGASVLHRLAHLKQPTQPSYRRTDRLDAVQQTSQPIMSAPAAAGAQAANPKPLVRLFCEPSPALVPADQLLAASPGGPDLGRLLLGLVRPLWHPRGDAQGRGTHPELPQLDVAQQAPLQVRSCLRPHTCKYSLNSRTQGQGRP